MNHHNNVVERVGEITFINEHMICSDDVFAMLDLLRYMRQEIHNLLFPVPFALAMIIIPCDK
jgi:hypothetical protein